MILALALALVALAPAPVRADDDAAALEIRGQQATLRLLSDMDLARARGDARAVGCLDRVLSRVSAVRRQLADVASRARPGGVVTVLAARLDELDDEAELCRSPARVTDGEADVGIDGPRRGPRIARDGLHFRAGPAFWMTLRQHGIRYQQEHAEGARAGLGFYLCDVIRAELIAGVGLAPGYGPFGLLGGQLLLTSRWPTARLAIGIAASAVVASDQAVENDFGWVGVELLFPVELGFELSDRIGVVLAGGPTFLKPGELRVRRGGGVTTVQVELAL